MSYSPVPSNMTRESISEYLQCKIDEIQFDRLCKFIKSEIHKSQLKKQITVEEILAEVVLAALEARIKGKDIKYPFAWLKQVSRYKIFDKQRAIIRERVLSDNLGDISLCSQIDDPETLFKRIDLSDALSKLNEADKLLIYLKVIQNQTYQEIQKKFRERGFRASSENALAQKYQRAIDKLRKLYEGSD